MLLRFAFIILLVVGCIARLCAQAGQEQITVHVTYEDDRTTPANLRVELLSAFGSIIETTITDGVGAVVFRHLQPAKYKLRVTGEGAVTTETGPIDLSEVGPNDTEYVRVRKIVPGSPAGAPGLSSVSDLKIPPKATKEFEEGMEKFRQKNWVEAKDHFGQALFIYPKYAAAQSGLAMSYANLGQGEKAVAAFRDALAIDENMPAPNLYLGQFYYENKQYTEAERYLSRAVEAEPRDAQVLTALANTEFQNGELNEALAHARRVHTLAEHKKYAVAHLIAADVLRRQKAPKQELAAEYKLFLEEDPGSSLVPRVKEALAKLEATPE